MASPLVTPPAGLLPLAYTSPILLRRWSAARRRRRLYHFAFFVTNSRAEIMLHHHAKRAYRLATSRRAFAIISLFRAYFEDEKNKTQSSRRRTRARQSYR